jgi:putative ABC transport system permease protein
MTGFRFTLRLAGRELARQHRRLALMVLCLAAGFAALFATTGFQARVLAGLRAESRDLLGADLALSSRGLLPAGAWEQIQGMPGLAGATLVYDFPSMASTGLPPGGASTGLPPGGTSTGLPPGGQSFARLVEVRAVQGPYPLAGRLETVPPRDSGEPWGVLVEAALAQAWGLAPGRPDLAPEALLAQHRGLRLGDGVVPVQAVVGADDSRQAAAFALGPRVYLGLATARRLGLVTPRARLSGRILAVLQPGADLARARAWCEATLLQDWRLRLQTHEEAAPALAQPIRNINRFIGQLGLFTLFLAALGAWAILAGYLKGREQDAAILRCLGAPPGAPATAYALVAAACAVAAMVLGWGAALLAGRTLPRLLGDLMPAVLARGPAALPPLGPAAAAALMLALVTVPMLARLRERAPLAALRGTEPAAGSATRRGLDWACGLAAAGGAVALILDQAPSRAVGAATAAGMALLFLALYGCFRLALRLLRRAAERLPLALKLALGQLGARPALGALLMAVIGLAVFLVLAVQLVKDDLVRPLAAQHGAGRRPNLFCIDVQPDQIGPLRDLLRLRCGREPLASPVVRARLQAIAGRPVEELPPGPEGPERAQSLRTREQNLTWRTRLSDSETVTAGAFWPEAGPDRAEVSLEQGFARAIGAAVGDELTFDAQGFPLQARVTSLRKVTWISFQPNFFIVCHPSLLAGLPATWIVAAELDSAEARAALQREVAAAWPNVTVLDVGEVVARIGRVLDLVERVARVLAGLMAGSALLVLSASLAALRLARARDLALLRTLGAGPGTLLASLAWEFLLLGGVSALVAGGLAWFLARAYSVRVLELEAGPGFGPALALALLAAALTAAVGLLGSLRALRARPMEVLREE